MSTKHRFIGVAFFIGLLFPQFSIAAGSRVATDRAATAAVARAFAESHILGTGGSQFLTAVTVRSNSYATATIGQIDGYGKDPGAYNVTLRKIDGNWKVVTLEFVFRQTGEKKVEKINPPFPDPYWDELAKRLGE